MLAYVIEFMYNGVEGGRRQSKNITNVGSVNANNLKERAHCCMSLYNSIHHNFNVCVVTIFNNCVVTVVEKRRLI